MSDPALVREWMESVNGRIADDASIQESQSTRPIATQDGSDVPSYYASDAQILMQGDSAMLLFARPHPAALSDCSITPSPLRKPVAMIGMNIHGLADLSNTIGAVIQQIENQGQESNTNFSACKQDATRLAEPGVLPKDGRELACSPTIPPNRRRALQERLMRFKRMLLATVVGRGVFKAVALLGAFALILAMWSWGMPL